MFDKIPTWVMQPCRPPKFHYASDAVKRAQSSFLRFLPTKPLSVFHGITSIRFSSWLGKWARISGKIILQQYFGIPKWLNTFSLRSGQSFPVLQSWFISMSIHLSVQKHRSPNRISESHGIVSLLQQGSESINKKKFNLWYELSCCLKAV